MGRKKQAYRLTLRNDIWQYRLPDPDRGWHSTGVRGKENRDAAVKYVLVHYGDEVKPKTPRTPVLTLSTFLEPYYVLGRCPYVAYKQSKDQRSIRQFSKTHIVRARARIENYILKDRIASAKLADITSEAVEAFQLRLVNAGVGARTVNQTVGTLKTCLSDAVRRGLFDRRITVSNIRYDEKETGVYTSEQLQAMFSTVPGPFKDRQAQTFFLLLATSGCRRGEAMAIKWKSIDLDSGKMQVVEAMRESKEIVHPKWGSTRKDVQLPDFTIQRLREYRRDCYHVLPTDFVFCHPTGVPFSGGWVTENFRYMQKQIGFYKDAEGHRLTVHAFRHTYCTVGQKQGLSAEAMQAIVGWSNKEIADRYSHLRAGDYAEVKTIWSKILQSG